MHGSYLLDENKDWIPTLHGGTTGFNEKEKNWNIRCTRKLKEVHFQPTQPFSVCLEKVVRLLPPRGCPATVAYAQSQIEFSFWDSSVIRSADIPLSNVRLHEHEAMSRPRNQPTQYLTKHLTPWVEDTDGCSWDLTKLITMHLCDEEPENQPHVDPALPISIELREFKILAAR